MKMKKINNIIEEEILRNSLDLNLQNISYAQKSQEEKIKNIANLRMDSNYTLLKILIFM